MHSIQNCHRSLRRLVWLSFCFGMLDPLSAVWSQGTSDRDQLLRGVTEFESKFFGKEVDVIVNYQGGSKASTRFLRNTHLLSHDGRITVAIEEYELTARKARKKMKLIYRTN